MFAAAQLAGFRRFLDFGVEVEPHRRDMLVDLVVKKALLDTEAQRRHSHQNDDQALHLCVVTLGCFGKANGPAWPDVPDEVALALRGCEVGVIRPAFAPKVVVFLKVRRRHVGVAVAERFVADRLVTPRALDIGWNYVLLLLHRQGEELMRLAVECRDDLGWDAVAGDGEETNLCACPVDQLAKVLARCTVGRARIRDINDGNLGFHFPYSAPVMWKSVIVGTAVDDNRLTGDKGRVWSSEKGNRSDEVRGGHLASQSSRPNRELTRPCQQLRVRQHAIAQGQPRSHAVDEDL